MKVWQIILTIVATICICLFLNKKEKVVLEPFVKNNSDSLYKIIDSLKTVEDSLILEIKTLKQNTKKVIIKYYEKDNNIRNLNADSNIKLFAKWNRQLQDSNYKARYFRISTDTIY